MLYGAMQAKQESEQKKLNSDGQKAIKFLDLDNFKSFLDEVGKKALSIQFADGDTVLHALAKRYEHLLYKQSESSLFKADELVAQRTTLDLVKIKQMLGLIIKLADKHSHEFNISQMNADGIPLNAVSKALCQLLSSKSSTKTGVTIKVHKTHYRTASERSEKIEEDEGPLCAEDFLTIHSAVTPLRKLTLSSSASSIASLDASKYNRKLPTPRSRKGS